MTDQLNAAPQLGDYSALRGTPTGEVESEIGTAGSSSDKSLLIESGQVLNRSMSIVFQFMK